MEDLNEQKILEKKMTTHKFLASDSSSAMEEVVKKLGPDALIISTSK